MPAGQIVRAISGFYYVRSSEGEEIQCRARGVFKFKKKKLTPLVGDYVQYEMTGPGEGFVVSVEPRQTELLRPSIANVDQAVVVCSLREPDFQQIPVDRFLVHGERAGLELIICLTKRDLVDDDSEVEQIRDIYKPAGYPVIATSIRTRISIDELKKYLAERTSVFAGQSGVGKSSLLNELLPDFRLETGTVSRKLGRGRHTTRQVELLPLNNGGQVADTPGFSQLSFRGFDAGELGSCFPEMREYSACCRFRGCLHLNEPGCAVKEAVKNEEIHANRYNNYLQFLTEIKEEHQRRY